MQMHNVFFPFLADLKGSYVQKFVYNYIVGAIIYRNMMYLIIVQKQQAEAKLYWNKEMIPVGNSNPQKEI